ncbi:hypothetical protein AMECASPLE_023710 [Ameca splendens]|uniref:Uncharacterized protein n=1 Tax=Ameca splendens TaxID=208324 RepID=A0ABV0ZDZ9_9TELE
MDLRCGSLHLLHGCLGCFYEDPDLSLSKNFNFDGFMFLTEAQIFRFPLKRLALSIIKLFCHLIFISVIFQADKNTYHDHKTKVTKMCKLKQCCNQDSSF